MHGWGREASLVSLVALGIFTDAGNLTALVIGTLALFVVLYDGGYRVTAAGRVSARRSVDRSEIPWGEHLTEVVAVSNPTGRRARLAAVEPTNLPEHDGGFVVQLHAHSDVTETIPVVCRHRGVFTLGQIAATYLTPLGLWPRNESIGQPLTVLVLPRAVALHRLALPVGGLSVGEETGAGQGEMPPLVQTVREYVRGDALGHIAWHKTAQTGQLMTRVYEPEVRTAVHLVIDAHATPGSDIEEVLATIAASIAQFAIRERHLAVGLVTPGHRAGELVTLPPRDGSFRHIQRALAMLRADPFDDLTGQIDHALHLRRGQVVILLTSRSAASWEGHVRAWSRLARVGVVQITDAPTASVAGWPVPALPVPRQYADPAWADELRLRLETGA